MIAAGRVAAARTRVLEIGGAHCSLRGAARLLVARASFDVSNVLVLALVVYVAFVAVVALVEYRVGRRRPR